MKSVAELRKEIEEERKNKSDKEIKVALPKSLWDIMSKAFHKGDLDGYLESLSDADKNKWMYAMEQLLRALGEN